MRKLKNILLLFSMLFVILLASACSMKKENPTKSYELLINDSKVVITYTYTEKEEKVLKEKVKSTFKYIRLIRD
jgi:lipoprotein